MGELQELGFTVNEERIYLTLLEMGESIAGDIAKKSQVHRRNTYDTLAKLVEKGFVSYVKRGKSKQYRAIHPQRIVEDQKEKLHISEDILPQLLATFRMSRNGQDVVTLEGKEGMKAFFLDFVEGEGERMALGSTGQAYEKLKYFFPKVLARLKTMTPPVQTLWSSDAIMRDEIERLINSVNRTLPEEYSSPTQLFIYKDKVAITIWSEKPIIVIIRSAQIQEGFKKYFNFLWERCG